MTGFSDEAWQRTAQLREAIHKLPFNIELAAGTLSRTRFQAYIVQDALYLSQYSRALAIAAAKAPDAETLRAFAQSALEAVMVEQALHERYMKEFGVDPAKITDAEASPDCFAYTNFLMAAAYHDPWEILVAVCCLVSGSIGMWAVSFPESQRRRTPIEPGSTPMPTRALARSCGRS